MPDSPLFDAEAAGERPRTPLAQFANGAGRAAAWLFLLAVLISFYEVVMRYAFNRPSSWAHESVTTLCALCFALGGAFAMARGEHIRISVAADRMRPGAQALAGIVGLIVGACYLAGLGWGLWIQAEESVLRFGLQGQWQPELTPGPPNWPLPSLVKGALLAATLLFLALVVERLAAALMRRA